MQKVNKMKQLMINSALVLSAIVMCIALAVAMIEAAVGCGGHYIDRDGKAHVNPCFFIK